MKKRILIVDDEDDILNLVCLILEDAGFDCETARNGKEALNKIQQQNFDLVLLDIMMPILTGWEVLRTLRDNKQTRNLPVAMLTARAFSSETPGMEITAYSDYIMKPFEPDELVARVNRILTTKATN
jgi:DNA-binding response OmpR family regulator